jgi:hypothetical protein
MWLIDGNNVMGSRPDGWWRDRAGAMQRLVNELDDFAAAGREVVVVFDGRERDLQAVGVRVEFAGHADDRIAALAEEGWTVATSDRELAERVRAKGASVEGAATFLGRL